MTMSKAEKINISQLMRGHVQVKNEPPSNIVRIFLSSTFTDMTNERNVLYNNAYPELQTFCQNLGLEFQVIDMRWGVRDTAVVDHSTTSLCLLEVQACKKVSAGPYFVLIVGNRYGYQPLPNSISEEEFQVLRNIANEIDNDAPGLMETWYKLDSNNIPDTRILERITTHFAHYDNPEPQAAQLRENERQEWNNISNKLVTVLRDAAGVATKRGLLKTGAHLKYSKSVTHMEVDEALMGNRRSTILAFNREISDLDKHMNDQSAGRYIDMVDGQYTVDKLRQKMLQQLKKKLQQSSLSKQIHNYQISWRYLEDLQHDHVTEDIYLKSFCDKFVSDIKKGISNSLDQDQKRLKKAGEKEDPLLDEILHHARLQFTKTMDFCGREHLISSIIEMLMDETNSQPIVLCGRSGCGKTALVAKLVEKVRSAMPRSTIIYRFLGTSPDSSSIHKVLKNVMLQLSITYSYEAPPSYLLQNFTDLMDHFLKLLRKVSCNLSSKEETLLLFLDSIDQLSQEDGAHRMHWLPKVLPSRVKIVISSLPEPDYEVVPIMRKHVNESNVVIVEGLTMETANEISEKYLKIFDRRLTKQQTMKILAAFENSPYPLFLKLMLEEAKRWRSNYDVQELILPKSARAAIAKFYERLENEHGKVIVSSALSFIIAARDGVTEQELLDLLTLDDEVLYEAYQYWSPPTEGSVRVPSFTWTRLKHDLGNYLVKRQAAGHTVLALLHRQFIEVGKERYLQNKNASRIYEILSEYFLGTFSDGKKKRLNLNMWSGCRDVDRRVARQPIKFSDAIYNVRKLRELPFCLLKASCLETLKVAVLANPEWILAKCKAFSIKEAIEDYNIYLNECQDIEIKLIRDSITLAKPTLEFPGGVRNHLYVELFCRLEFFAEKFPQYLGNLTKNCHRLLENDRREILLPFNGCFQSPGGPLRTTITGFKLPVSCLKFVASGDVFVAGSQEGNIIIWDSINDESLQRIEAHTKSVISMDLQESPIGLKVASCSWDGHVKVFDADNGNQCFEQSIPELNQSALFSDVKLSGEIVVSAVDKKIHSWSMQDKQLLFELELQEYVTAISSSTGSDSQLWVGFRNGEYSPLNVSTGEHRMMKNDFDSPVLDIMCPANDKLLLLWKRGDVALIEVSDGKILDSFQIEDGNIVDWSFDKYFDFATDDEVLTFSVHGDILTKSSCLPKQDHKIQKICRFETDKIAVAYQNKKIIVWHTSSAETATICSIWEGMGASIDHLIIGKQVGVTASNQVFYLKVWDIQNEEQVQTPDTLPLSDSPLCVLRTDGEELVYIDGHELVKRSATDVRQCKKMLLACDRDNVNDLKLIEDDILVLYKDGFLSKMTIPRNEEEEEETIHTDQIRDAISAKQILISSVQSNGGRTIIVARDGNHHVIYIIDTSTLKLLSTVRMTSNEISSDITSSYFLNGEQRVVIFGTSNGSLHRITFHPERGSIMRNVIASSKHVNAISCLSASPDNTLLFSGSLGRTRRLWDIRNGALLLRHELQFNSLLTSGVTCAQFSIDSKYVATGSKERSITVWNTEKGTLIGAQYVYATVLDIAVTNQNEVVFTTELGYICRALFRPPMENEETHQKEQHSRTCTII